MKALGIVLIITGVMMCIFTTFSFNKEKKLVDIGPLQVNQQERHTVGWPVYVGIAVGLFGIALLAIDKKEN